MLAAREAEKYADIWSLPDYARHSPGRDMAPFFWRVVRPEPGQTVIDLGCGKGEGGRELTRRGLRVTYLDVVNVGAPDPFLEQPLWRPIPGHYDLGYCCDVMEHLPEPFVMLAVSRMLDACDRVFLSVAFGPDAFGAYIGEPLHLTVKPFTWWRDNLLEMGRLVDARDLIGEGVFVVEH